ncbi:ABC transporter permease subunit [Streptomyces sp. NPDC047081]|uniref:ABC transporter permease subunit n=1 Tax=Streptomyces sp. NPDC047081 TaxID=3154706 RepID=UPI0033EA19DC
MGSNTTLICLANLQSVPQERVEAARIDGASRFQVFRYVTWPMLAGAVTVKASLALFLSAACASCVVVVNTAYGFGGRAEV